MTDAPGTAVDTMTTLGRSLIQHGKSNDRIYLMKLNDADAPQIVAQLNQLAGQERYSKIFAKVPSDQAGPFLDAGFQVEAHIPGYFGPGRGAMFMGRFLNPSRCVDPRSDRCREVLAAAKLAADEPAQPPTDGWQCRVCNADDADAMADLYREVFESYPFPIHDPQYLRQTMRTHIIYFGAWIDGELAALSSAETDSSSSSVEMTDFATLPRFRGRRLAQGLLARMDQEMAGRAFRTGYTIARSLSFGMNITFARAGYRYGGTLINNTQICGQLESMNVWYKTLSRTQ